MDKHEATHLIDRECCVVMKPLTRCIEAAHAIGAGDDLMAVLDSLKAFHAKAMEAHRKLIE